MKSAIEQSIKEKIKTLARERESTFEEVVSAVNQWLRDKASF